MLIGYARISKADGSQSLDLQRDALREAGVSDDAIYEDQASGQREDRPGLAAFLKAARQGDVISSSGGIDVPVEGRRQMAEIDVAARSSPRPQPFDGGSIASVAISAISSTWCKTSTTGTSGSGCSPAKGPASTRRRPAESWSSRSSRLWRNSNES